MQKSFVNLKFSPKPSSTFKIFKSRFSSLYFSKLKSLKTFYFSPYSYNFFGISSQNDFHCSLKPVVSSQNKPSTAYSISRFGSESFLFNNRYLVAPTILWESFSICPLCLLLNKKIPRWVLTRIYSSPSTSPVIMKRYFCSKCKPFEFIYCRDQTLFFRIWKYQNISDFTQNMDKKALFRHFNTINTTLTPERAKDIGIIAIQPFTDDSCSKFIPVEKAISVVKYFFSRYDIPKKPPFFESKLFYINTKTCTTLDSFSQWITTLAKNLPGTSRILLASSFERFLIFCKQKDSPLLSRRIVPVLDYYFSTFSKFVGDINQLGQTLQQFVGIQLCLKLNISRPWPTDIHKVFSIITKLPYSKFIRLIFLNESTPISFHIDSARLFKLQLQNLEKENRLKNGNGKPQSLTLAQSVGGLPPPPSMTRSSTPVQIINTSKSLETFSNYNLFDSFLGWCKDGGLDLSSEDFVSNATLADLKSFLAYTGLVHFENLIRPWTNSGLYTFFSTNRESIAKFLHVNKCVDEISKVDFSSSGNGMSANLSIVKRLHQSLLNSSKTNSISDEGNPLTKTPWSFLSSMSSSSSNKLDLFQVFYIHLKSTVWNRDIFDDLYPLAVSTKCRFNSNQLLEIDHFYS